MEIFRKLLSTTKLKIDKFFTPFFLNEISLEDWDDNEYSGNKLSFNYLKKVFIDDYRSFRKRGLAELAKRWFKRKDDLHLILPAHLKKYISKKQLNKNKKLLKDLSGIENVTSKDFSKVLSVVINTKNSPSFFEEILEKYTHQNGFKKVEVIIVDSGSTDNTLEIAEEHGCKIIQIPSEEFRHGKSRNVGIKEASGDYIIIAVSDAIPYSLDLASTLVSKLENNLAAAVSVRQIPRIDADIFAIWSVYEHSKFMSNNSLNDIWVSGVRNFDQLDFSQKRKLTLIEDVFVLHRAEDIKKEKYNEEVTYAEDLHLSINYIKKGLKIGFLPTEAVIHSHTRSPEYFFKRYFVDTLVINESFNLEVTKFEEDISELDNEYLSNIVYSITNKAHGMGISENWTKKYLDVFGENERNDVTFNSIWEEEFTENFSRFERFLTDTQTIDYDKNLIMSKLASMTSGTLLANILTVRLRKNGLTKETSNFKKLMEMGI
ncbi:MAG TPA: glycosyltransferase [Candidatus Saccharimonadales bacterium]|nr:glycosyltransferase [Candidatus Saccharimonadales bacterium]